MYRVLPPKYLYWIDGRYKQTVEFPDIDKGANVCVCLFCFATENAIYIGANSRVMLWPGSVYVQLMYNVLILAKTELGPVDTADIITMYQTSIGPV